jgi:hypothetical protein
MWLDVIGRLQPAPTSVGPGDWIALGSFLALLLVAFVGPNVFAGLVTSHRAHHPDAGAHGLTPGTAA